jgi:hypothetical protein
MTTKTTSSNTVSGIILIYYGNVTEIQHISIFATEKQDTESKCHGKRRNALFNTVLLKPF